MSALFAIAALVGLLVLHFAILPQLAAGVLGVPPGVSHVPGGMGRHYFIFWSACIALYTVLFYVTSVAVWGRAGYLGTLLYMAAQVLWLFKFLSGSMRQGEENEGFDLSLSATLAGSVFGTAIGWGIGRLL